MSLSTKTVIELRKLPEGWRVEATMTQGEVVVFCEASIERSLDAALARQRRLLQHMVEACDRTFLEAAPIRGSA